MSVTDFAREVRLLALELCYKNGTSHIGSAFSAADILAVLYRDVLNVDPAAPGDPGRDRFFYSKGHACVALYAALALRGYFSREELLNRFTKDGSYFTAHINHELPGIELSTGSLGHALGVACGAAVAGKRKKQGYSVFALLSDGELDEGSNWEAILFAAHHRLDNLVLIVDYNKIQSFGRVDEVMALEPLLDKLLAFNWDVLDVDGHSPEALHTALSEAKSSRRGQPKCLIAHTVKGKGVGFMENRLLWHYRSPAGDEYLAAVAELSGGGGA